MRIDEAIDVIFSHNEVLSIWEEIDKYSDGLLWKGMAWDLPQKYKNITNWRIFGAIRDNIWESDQICIRIENNNKNKGNEINGL